MFRSKNKDTCFGAERSLTRNIIDTLNSAERPGSYGNTNYCPDDAADWCYLSDRRGGKLTCYKDSDCAPLNGCEGKCTNYRN